MSIVDTTEIDVLASVVLPVIRASGAARPSKWLLDWAGGAGSDSGIKMSTDKALSYAPVVQAISVLAGDVGQLPLDLYRRIDARDREKERAAGAYRIARRRANPYMSAATFRETLMLHVLLYGNGLAEIERNQRTEPVALWPLVPQWTFRVIAHGALWYVTRAEPGGVERRLRPENVVHISNFGLDGTWGHSTITMARNSWGLGLAGEKYANHYFKNNGVPSGTLEHPGHLSDDVYERLRRDWRQIHEGLDNTARLAILEEGTKYAPIAFNHKDSQWLESREFQREDVASWFNLPPHKLGVLKDANYSNIVEKNRDYLGTGLMRWLVKWQDEYDEKLLSGRQKAAGHYYEFNTDALLRADTETRFGAYAKALGGHPFMEINEVRGRENMNSVDGGDEIPAPLNMSTGQATATAATEAKIGELLRCEANRVCHAARSAKNFVGWLETFYGRWRDTLESALGGAPGLCNVRDAAVAWAESHQRECLAVAGEVTDGERLEAGLAALTGGWSLSVRALVEQLTEEERDETC